MARYELTITPNYVSNWTVDDALREIFQNAIDESNSNPEHVMEYDYSEDNETLTVFNKGAFLEKKTLLLGETSKSGGNTIGQFGEGYKIATIVLLRYGLSLVINNANEVWTPRIVKSRRYGSDIVVFDVKKSKNTVDGLEFKVQGLDCDTWKNFEDNKFLSQSKYPKCERTEFGNVLLDEEYKGKVYVCGLYICENEQLCFGYDFVSSVIKLDRDRGLVDYFDMRVACGKVLNCCENKEVIEKSLSFVDSDFIVPSWDERIRGTALKTVAEDLAKKHLIGLSSDCVITTNIDKYTELVGLGKKAKYISEKEHRILESSETWPKQTKFESETSSVKDMLIEWFDDCKKELSDDLIERGQVIVDTLVKFYLSH